MRLIDADELIKQGWVLTRHGVSNCLIGVKSIADVPTAFDLDGVLNKLNELSEESFEPYLNSYSGTRFRGYEDGKSDAYEMAIQIIKAGR